MKSVVSIQHNTVKSLPRIIPSVPPPHSSYFQAVAALCLFAAVAADAEAKPEAEADAYYGHHYGYGLAHHGYGYAHHGYYGYPYAHHGYYYGKRLVFLFQIVAF